MRVLPGTLLSLLAALQVATTGCTAQTLDPSSWTVASIPRPAAGYEAESALDGDSNSFWHTPLSDPPGPHTLEIVFGGNRLSLAGLTYLPRPTVGPGNKNGRIGEYEIQVHSQAHPSQFSTPYRTVVSGQFPDTPDLKQISFSTPIGAYGIRIVSLSEAGGRCGGNGGMCTSAAEITLLEAVDRDDDDYDYSGVAYIVPPAGSLPYWMWSVTETSPPGMGDVVTDGYVFNGFDTTFFPGAEPPHSILVEFEGSNMIDGFVYLPVEGSTGQYEILVSTNGVDFFTVARGECTDNYCTIRFPPVEAVALRFEDTGAPRCDYCVQIDEIFILGVPGPDQA